MEEFEIQNETNRSEYVSVWVTPEVKQEFNSAKDNDSLKETIIRGFLKSESNWLREEMKTIDEATIKYKAKLLGIKDAFADAQDEYVAQIDQIHEKAAGTFKKLDSVADKLSDSISKSYEKIDLLNKKIGYIDSSRLEKLLDAIDRYSDMTPEQQELIKLIISQK